MRPETKSYLVTETDYFGKDYQHIVALTDKEAENRIVDGRLLSKAAGEARNYAKLWEQFKAQDRYNNAGRLPSKLENDFINYKNQEKL